MKIHYRTISTAFALVLIATASFSCKKEKSVESGLSPVGFRLNLLANGETLKLNTDYINEFAEDYSVSTFKFYISNISIGDGAGNSATESESYHLVDASSLSSQQFDAQLGRITFNRLRFLVGVDSLRNVSGAQSGALDPMNGMFWTWNSGYIMAKLEGTSPYSTDPGQRFQYHIGGFSGAEATQRWVTLSFPGDKAYTLTANHPLTISIDVNLDKWFRSAHDLPISASPLVMTPGDLSVKYADNYATLFSVTKVTLN
jgi:hypothetical protein